MSLSLRPLIGLAAAFLTMAAVAIAGMTAPDAKTTAHAASRCQDAGPAEAERPA